MFEIYVTVTYYGEKKEYKTFKGKTAPTQAEKYTAKMMEKDNVRKVEQI